LWETLTLEQIDGLIHVLNQYRTDPEDRLNDYLQKCAEEWQQQNEDKWKSALGIRDGVTIIDA